MSLRHIGRVRHAARVAVGHRHATPVGNVPQKETGFMRASVLFGAGWEDDSLEVLWRDTGRAFCTLRRSDANRETHAFIPIPFGSENPSVESVNRLTHEYGLQDYLDGGWALRPLDLVRERGQTMLVVD